jgi:GYF domain 2
MMFEDLSVHGGSGKNLNARSDQDHKWHVVLSRDEVKIVSLDQLDDLYRLSIIDAETQVWQNGMSEWQALRVLAGLDEESGEPARRHPKPPRRAPPQPLVSDNEVLAFSSLALHSFDSVRPLAASSTPARRGGWFSRSLVALALIAGLSVTLYRTGALREMAHFVARDAWYVRVDSTLAHPAWGATQAAARGATSQLYVLFADNAHTQVVPNRVSAAPAIRHAITAPVLATPHDARGTTPDPMTPVVSLESLPPEVEVAPRAAAVVPEIQAPEAHALPGRSPKANGAPPRVAPQAPGSTTTHDAVLQPGPRQRVTMLQTQSKRAPILKASAPATHPARTVSNHPIASRPRFMPTREEASPGLASKASAAPPGAQRSEAPMTELERLNAVIGQSVHGRAGANAKPASQSNEYDPLNPNL